jgi:steroid delta-isomerase-like uncharacterized protein
MASNIAIVKRWNEELWKGNWAIYDEAVAPNCIFHGIGGPEEHRRFIGGFRTAFPDCSVTIEDQLAQGEKVVVRFTWRGTHQGAFWGAAPTGKQMSVTAITIQRLAAGKIVEEWTEADLLRLQQQLGILPPGIGAIPN